MGKKEKKKRKKKEKTDMKGLDMVREIKKKNGNCEKRTCRVEAQ